MAKRVSFGVYWQEYGRQSVTLPDSVNTDDPQEVKKYVESIFDDLPLPSGGYIDDSAEIDFESDFIVEG